MISTAEHRNRLGGCACGAIRYRLSGEPLFIHACHCTDCQNLTGSAFGITVIYDEDDFAITQGTPAMLGLTGGSGAVKQAHRCAVCGGNLFGTTDSRPGTISVRPGSLDDSSWIRPQAHIWTRSKQGWVVLPGDTPCFDTHYELKQLWPATSQQKLARICQRLLSKPN